MLHACPIQWCCVSATPELPPDQSHCRSLQRSLIDAAQHRGVTTAMLAFLGRFLPKLGGVRFGGRRSFFV
jgi:hypothetical protein